jgi:cytochrome d ubiquinol oxidase subunit II
MAATSALAQFTLIVAKTDAERRQVLASIGSVWDANEVWLIAAGGTLYLPFRSYTRAASADFTFRL